MLITRGDSFSGGKSGGIHFFILVNNGCEMQTADLVV